MAQDSQPDKTSTPVPSVGKQKEPAVSEIEGIQIPEKALKLARQVGIDLTPLIRWGQNVDVQLKAQGHALETLGVKLEPLIQLAERARATQSMPPSGPAPQPTGDLLSLITQLAPVVLGGGSSNPIADKVMNLALESLGLGNALMKSIIIKTAPDLATTLLAPYGGVAPKTETK